MVHRELEECIWRYRQAIYTFENSEISTSSHSLENSELSISQSLFENSESSISQDSLENSEMSISLFNNGVTEISTSKNAYREVEFSTTCLEFSKWFKSQSTKLQNSSRFKIADQQTIHTAGLTSLQKAAWEEWKINGGD